MTNTTDTLITTDLTAGLTRVMLSLRTGPQPAIVTAIVPDPADSRGVLVSLRTEAAIPATVTLEAARDEVWQAAPLTTGERRMYAAAAAVADALLEGLDTAAALQEYAVARFAYVDR